MKDRFTIRSIVMIAMFVAILHVRVFADSTFTASIDGLQAVPVTSSNAAASGTVILNSAENQVTVTIFAAGLSSQQLGTAIHGPAATGTNGPVIFELPPGNISQNLSISAQQAADLKAGLWYFQIRTTGFPAGEIRAQIVAASNGSDAVPFPASSGALDLTFGTNGILTTPIGPGNAVAQAVAVQPDGKIVVGGYAFNGTNNDFAVVRYNPNGGLDETFDGAANGNGIVIFAVGASDDEAFGIVLQNDGKILLAGESFNGANYDSAVVRLNPDGTPDNTFDGDGRVTVAVGPGADSFRSVVLQSDGKIVVAGTASNGIDSDISVVRLLPNGTPDTTFDGDSGTGNGIVRTAVGTGNDLGFVVGIGPNETIIVSGYYFLGTGADAAIVRYDMLGRLDTTFSGDGIFVHPFSSDTDEALAMALQPDGKIVIAGCVRNGGPNDFLLARISSNGVLDQTFGNAGVQIVAFSGAVDIAFAVAVQTDGKIVAAGFGNNGTNNDFAVTRVNANGSLDQMFDFDGRAMTMFGTSVDAANAIAIQADGKIVAAGRAVIGSTARFGVARYGYGTNAAQNDGFLGLNTTTAIRFDNAFATGTTTSVGLNSAAMPPLPSPLSFVASPRAVVTSASFSGNIVVRMTLPSAITAANFDAVRAMQFENGTWYDKTADAPPRDFATRTIYARLTTLSPIAAASPLGPVIGLATVSGRILTTGKMDPGSLVSVAPISGTPLYTFANPQGFYSVANLTIGGTYIVRALSKRRSIAPLLISVNENLFEVDLGAQ